MTVRLPSRLSDRSGIWPDAWVGNPFRVLVIVALALASANSLLFRLREQGDELGWRIAAVAIVAIAVAFILHPRWPETMIAVVAVTLTACVFVPEIRTAVEAAPPVLYAAYLASAHSRRRWRRTWLVWMLAGTGAVTATGLFAAEASTAGDGDLIVLVLGTAFVWAVIGFFWLLGGQTRRRREDLVALRERAETAGFVERSRIAREMHDIVAHNLSGIIALADGARYAATKNPQAAVDTLGTISVTGREALSQMRGLLSVLRTDDTRDQHAAPGVAEISALVDDSRRAGLDITVTGLGQLPDDLPDLAQFTVYRLIQEMLTNMLNHSAAGSGTLAVMVTDRAVIISSRNSAGQPPGEAGFGLVGMAERVRAHDGRLTHGFDDGYFTVTAEVPR